MEDEDIFDFINSSRVATVCCVGQDEPHCFNCFYSFMYNHSCIVFKSAESSKHTGMLRVKPLVAGTIYSTSGMDNVGVQFNGEISYDKQLNKHATSIYYKRFPLAVVIPGSLYVVLLKCIKFTRTINGVRSKTTWLKQ